ncbi:unnamed protein product [Vicia faba]|uniref:Methyltransferase n=1 Tax=Vicia faba TaxID=3906 RepID=A0AAV0ZB69_VICFA|nr:unnamed protein product [Vicia faba]
MPSANSTSPKPFKPNKSTSFLNCKKTNLYSLLALLCIISYLLGSYQNTTSSSSTTTTKKTSTTQCLQKKPTTNPTPNEKTTNLDFFPHHNTTDPTTTSSTTSSSSSNHRYPPCTPSLTDYTPCEDRARSLKHTRDRMIYRERHCPKSNEILKCRVPAPKGYKNPFPWPTSRDMAWYANVPYRHLTVEKAVQNWIRFDGDRFRFPGGGTMFPDGADKYIDDIGKLINLKDGSVRTAVDTGCGVASWGAYLLSRNILTVSIAPRDTHEAQVQFALERGVPAIIGVLASKRLPFPSRAFDMAHCSRCLIPWPEYDGLYLNEIDRILRPGGYWILSGPPIHWKKYWKGWERTKEDLNEEQTKIENVAKSLCWNKLVEKDDIAIWQKPKNHFDCTQNRPFCQEDNKPDKAWYTNMQTCLSPLPKVSNKEETSGGALNNWPQRLKSTPPRISKGTIKSVTPQTFSKDNQLWNKRVSYYKKVNSQLGKAAKVDTLGAVYERGLIGIYHNWCEAMSTYPRTYDLIHADSVFSLYNDRCEVEDILLEMDRILRPEGSIIIRDDVDILVKVKSIINGLDWESQIVDHEDGPLEREKLLFAVKKYWTSSVSNDDSS